MLRMMKKKRRASVRSGGAGSGASTTGAAAAVGAARGAKQLAHRKKEELLAQWRRFSNQRNKATQTDEVDDQRRVCVARTQTEWGFGDIDREQERNVAERRMLNHMPYTLHQSHIQNWENAGKFGVWGNMGNISV